MRQRDFLFLGVASLLAAFAFLATVAGINQLPPEFKRCKRDANFSSCFHDAITDSIKLLRPGSLQLGIPPLEPLTINEVSLGDGDKSAPVNFIIYLTDLEVHNITTMVLDKTSMDFDNFELLAQGNVEKLYIEANYKIDGRILLIPTKSEGRTSFMLSNVEARVRSKGDKFLKHERDYIRVKTFDLDLSKIGNIVVNFTSSNGDRTLDTTINNLINENWRELWGSMSHSMVETLEYIFKECYRRVVERIPFDDIFLPAD